MPLPTRFFVTGTDTGVGKTFISAILTLGLKAHYWKPIQSGVREGTDTDWIRQTTGLPAEHFLPEAYSLTEPLSPHAAADLDGVEIELSSLRLPHWQPGDRLIVEGAGGLMVPLNREFLIANLIEQLNLPVLVVARSGLGTINHTVLTVTELKRREIAVLGVVMNGALNPSNRSAIERYASVPVLAEIEPITEEINRNTLLRVFNRAFEHLFACAGVPPATNVRVNSFARAGEPPALTNFAQEGP
jgi:dethiobiotin synthase